MKSKGKIMCMMCGKHGNEITHDEFVRREECERILSLLKKKLDAIKAHDKTPQYGYGRSDECKNNLGELPPIGERWATPRELADDIEKMFIKRILTEAVKHDR